MEKVTRQFSKDQNKRLILKTIYSGGEISRAELARYTDLTRTTVSSIVSELIKDGLVQETGLGVSDGGKPPVILQIDNHGRHLIGIDLGSNHLQGGVTDMRGNILYRYELPMQDQDGEAAVALVIELVGMLLAATDQPILGIGIGTPGLIDAPHGIIRQAVNLRWRDLPLGDLLTKRYNLPCYLSNDSHAAAVGEYIFGQHQKDCQNQVVIKAGRGISAGIILNGQLYVGESSMAGEIGHVTMLEGGELCPCGNTGCLETLVSTLVLVRTARELSWNNINSPIHTYASSPEAITTDMVYLAYNAGDPDLQCKAFEMAHYLGIVVANLVGLLNIESILIGGNLSQLGQPFLDAIRSEFYRHLNPMLPARVQIEMCSLGKDIVIKGAAALLLTNELGLI
ncbi:MAG: ROK family transcriptional regulator [Chloroflexi bacterium]|nr:ROK family transcriptional regulator [Chloroflexota bacterium]